MLRDVAGGGKINSQKTVLTFSGIIEYKKFLLLITVVIVSFLSYKLFYFFMDIEQIYQNKSKFSFGLISFLGTLNSYALAIFSGLVNLEQIQHMPSVIYFVFSYLFLALYFLVMFIYIKKKYYEITIIPLILMIFSLLFTTGVILFRYFPVDASINWEVASLRYTKFYELGVISMLWALLIILNNNKFNIANYFLAGISILLIVLNILFIDDYWKKSLFLINWTAKQEINLLHYQDNKNPESISKFVRMGSFTPSRAEFLIYHKFNVYSDNYNFKTIRKANR